MKPVLSLSGVAGCLLLIIALAAVIWLLVVPVLDGLGGRRQAGRGGRAALGMAIAAGISLAALGALAAFLAVKTADACTWLVLMGFVVIVVGLVALVVGLVRVVAAVIRRRGRLRAAAWTGAMAVVAAVAAAGLMLVSPASTPAPAAPLSGPSALDAYLRRIVAQGTPPSVAVVVVDASHVLYEGAAGRAGTGPAAASVDSVYKWWSCTKIVTAVAVLQLVEQGRVRLDDPVKTYLPWFDVVEPKGGRSVRVIDLLNQSSGLPNNVPEVVSWMHLEGQPGCDQLRLARAKLPDYRELQNMPGRVAVYTNVGYMVLGALVEQVSGERYEDYVEHHILQPLGMTSTGFTYSASMREREAEGSHPVANIQTAFLPLVQAPFPWGYIRACSHGTIWFNRFLADATPPTGLIGTPSDMARLAEAVLGGGGLRGRRILAPATTRLMLRHGWVIPGSCPDYAEYRGWFRQGLGWQVSRDARGTYWQHTGEGPGWAAGIRIYIDRPLGIVVMANGTSLKPATVADVIARMAWRGDETAVD